MTDIINRWLWGPWSRLGLTVALVALVLDQLHKWWMLAVWRMELYSTVKVTPFLNIVYVINKGISYGLGNGAIGQNVLASFAVLASLALAIWLARAATGRLMAASIGLIIGGAIGNAIDRLHLGGVADFFQLHIAEKIYWYVFNVADVAIVAGVVGLLYDSFVTGRNGAAKSP